MTHPLTSRTFSRSRNVTGLQVKVRRTLFSAWLSMPGAAAVWAGVTLGGLVLMPPLRTMVDLMWMMQEPWLAPPAGADLHLTCTHIGTHVCMLVMTYLAVRKVGCAH